MRSGLLARYCCWCSPAFLVPLALLALTALPAVAQVDTTAVASPLPEGHSPRGALWRAAAVPGWGQLYNRQYVKIPIVYLGLGGLTAAALLVNDRYLLYRHAYLFTARTNEDDTPVFPEYANDYADLIDKLGLPPESQLTEEEIESRRNRLESGIRTNRDALRRNRDLLYIGIGLWYGLSLLDAYVSAHLLDFDVSEDLSVRVQPRPHPGGLAATVHLIF